MDVIKSAKEIGKTGSNKYIWHSCQKCGRERWVQLRKGKSRSLLCFACSHQSEASHFWKGKYRHDERGYIRICASKADFFFPMAINKNAQRPYFLEHRLIMAKHLGRCLHSWEAVHHKNGIKDDNRIENLQLFSHEKHQGFTVLEQQINILRLNNQKLRGENEWLRKQLKAACATESM